ncbi:MAG: DUF971 domain-containing protein [Porticoccus sp.]|nr:DUF971 domain-containing protein [Porticoccus sp.]
MVPIKIKLHKEDGSLSLEYSDGSHFTLSGEYLRIHSPSAEVRGHGKGQEILQHGKKDIKVSSLESSGNYALQLTFSDDHDTGIYSWDYLYDLATNHSKYWQNYLAALHDAGKNREVNVQVVQLVDPKQI